MIRLLHVDTLQFQEFQDQPPPYAITSHRWQNEEATLADIKDSKNQYKRGFLKIQEFCSALRGMHELSPEAQPRIEWIWIDTCCINKADFTELSEAIISMFRWYAESAICLAYLHDVGPLSLTPRKLQKQFLESEWWNRGWTLQELLAPKTVVLFNSDWEALGHKASFELQPLSFSTYAIGHSLNLDIEARTGISKEVLADFSKAAELPIATKKSWMANRVTTRPEDRAYCQLGIFNIFMPLIYGERENAMTRLEEILGKEDVGTPDHPDAARAGLSNNGHLPLRGNKASSYSGSASPKSTRKANRSTKALADDLLRAAKSGNTSIVKKLLDEGADINAENEAGSTALHEAADNGYDDVARLLVQNGADITHRDSRGDTPLSSAAAWGDVEVSRILIEAGAKIDTRNNVRWTPLMIASWKMFAPLVDLLLDAGADIDYVDASGESALLKWANHPTPDRKMIQQLLDRGANLNLADRQGYTPLIRAAQKSHHDLVQTLLTKGADVDASTNAGFSALALMATQDEDDEPKVPYRTEIITLLVQAGANVNIRGQTNWTPLLLAALKNQADLVELLMNAGADVTAERNGRNASFYATNKAMRNLLLGALTQPPVRPVSSD